MWGLRKFEVALWIALLVTCLIAAWFLFPAAQR